jgi:hypothetical protein
LQQAKTILLIRSKKRQLPSVSPFVPRHPGGSFHTQRMSGLSERGERSFGGRIMKNTLSAAVLALAVSAAPAMAADLITKAPPAPAPAEAPSIFDIAFGGALMSDYNFRGITQSDHKPSMAAYFEPRWNVTPNVQLYAGISGEGIDFPNHAAAEVDFYGGIRPTIDKLSLDFGLWYYYYPGGIEFNGLGPSPSTCTNGFFTPAGFCNTLKSDVSFWEAYGKASLAVTDQVTLGANVFYSPSWLNSGAYGLYASGTAKVTAPSSMFPKDWGAYVSGELGHYWFGVTDAFYGTPLFPGGIQYPDYTTWNIGVAFTYKVFTLDFRWYDTDLSKTNCNVLTGDHTASFGGPGAVTPTNPSGLVSNWCGSAFIVKGSADLTFANLK